MNLNSSTRRIAMIIRIVPRTSGRPRIPPSLSTPQPRPATSGAPTCTRPRQCTRWSNTRACAACLPRGLRARPRCCAVRAAGCSEMQSIRMSLNNSQIVVTYHEMISITHTKQNENCVVFCCCCFFSLLLFFLKQCEFFLFLATPYYLLPMVVCICPSGTADDAVQVGARHAAGALHRRAH